MWTRSISGSVARRTAATLAFALAVAGAHGGAAAQADTVGARADTTLAQEGIYDRPFIGALAGTSVGGYLEGNTNYFVEEGVTEGFSMELRRFNIFLFSSISSRVRFLSELEFEHGTEEIALETALVDIQVRPGLVIRAGIILPPLGYFNQNHDSPKWDFVERPLVSTDIIPSTLSEVGGGVYGKILTGGAVLSYDAYVTNGLGDGVVDNELGRTNIPSGKGGEQLGEDNNGSPAFTGRVAARRPGLGEVGLSWYGGHYNAFRVEGVDVDERRRLSITALDAGFAVAGVELRGEAALARVDLPSGLAEVFGHRQWGAHLDVVIPVWRPAIPAYDDAMLALAVRVEHLDYNRGTFSSTGRSIGDEVTAVVAGTSFRPTPGTVFRANYRYHWTRDFVGNDLARAAGFQLGFATYF
jgi:hypothetical protein